MATMTWNEADRLLSYGNHTNECSVFNGQREPICNCGFGELRTEALDLLARGPAPKQADAEQDMGVDFGNFINMLWRDIILKHQPDYPDWEYPMQAYRHLVAEFNDLRTTLATVTAKRNEAFNVGTALEADLAAERADADGLAVVLRKVEWVGEDVDGEYGPWCEWCKSYKENSGHASDCGRQDTLRAHDARRAGRDGGEG